MNLVSLKFKLLYFCFFSFLTLDFYIFIFNREHIVYKNSFFKSYFFNENNFYLYFVFKIFSFVSGMFLYYYLIKLKQTEVCFITNMVLMFFISSYFV